MCLNTITFIIRENKSESSCLEHFFALLNGKITHFPIIMVFTSSFIVGETSRSRLIKNLEHWLKHAGTCIKGGKFKREEGDSNKKLKVLLFDSNFLRILIYE